jgi:c(7)-type cytochrome triheme protein
MMKCTDKSYVRLVGLMMFCLIAWIQWNGYAIEKDGEVVLYPSVSGAPGPVVFSHRSHSVRVSGCTYKGCHGASYAEAPMVTMDAIRSDRACGACHCVLTSESHGQTAAASAQDCAFCHMPSEDIVITLNRMDPVAFSHIRHLDANNTTKRTKSVGYTCSDCHPALFERSAKAHFIMELPHISGGCAQCHNGKSRSNGLPSAFPANTHCLTCHKPY